MKPTILLAALAVLLRAAPTTWAQTSPELTIEIYNGQGRAAQMGEEMKLQAVIVQGGY